MTQGGDLACWTGERMKSDIHRTFRSNFNAVHVHNKLSAGPRSVCNVATASLPLKLWLYLIACAKTSSYVKYMHNRKLSSDLYDHADLKLDLEQELLQCDFEAGAVSEEAGVLPLCSCDGVASGAMHIGDQSMPALIPGAHTSKVSTARAYCAIFTRQSDFVVVAGPFAGRQGTKLVFLGI
jgi:hypothetical protein